MMKKIMLFLMTIFAINVSAQHATGMLSEKTNPNKTGPQLTTGSLGEPELKDQGKSGRGTNYWTGAASVVWSNGNNWSLGHVPEFEEDVVVSGTASNQPIIYGGTYANCSNLTLESGAELIQHGTYADQSFLYVYGDLNTNDGQYTMNNNYTHLYFMGSDDNTWDDDNENDTYENIRILKSDPNARLTMYQDMTVNGAFTIQSGVFTINVQWELTLASTHTEALSVNSGGKLLLNDNQKVSVAGGIVFRNGSRLETHTDSQISCGGDFKVEPNNAYNIEFGTNSRLKMDGSGDQYIVDEDMGNLSLHGLHIDKPSGTVYIANYDLYVNGALNLFGNSTLSCKLSPSSSFSNDIYARDIWHQDATAGFEAATGRVIFYGPNHVHCEGNPVFNELEISKDPGMHWEVHGDVSCAGLDFDSGIIEMVSGSFTAGDVLDGGIYGNYILVGGTTVNLTNNDGFIDLNGSLTFNGGGTMNIYGGTSDSWWSYDGDVSVTMDAGVLDFHDRGIYLYDGSHSITTDISGGAIRTAKGFYGDNTGFDPTGGVVYCYTTSDGSLELAPANNFHSLIINKSSKSGSVNPNLETVTREGELPQTDSKSSTMTMISDMTINANLTIVNGVLDTDVHDIDIGGNWKNLVGPVGFLENENYVNFMGTSDADINSGETFYTLALSKTNTGFDALEIKSGETITVNNDLNLIDGGLEMNDNSTIDVAGSVTIMSGAGLNMYNDANLTLFVGGNWDNYNTYYNASGVGFHPGNGTVTFDGSEDQDLNTAATHEEFFNLVVDKPSYNLRTFDDLYIWGDYQALGFALVNPVASLNHYFFGDVYIEMPGYLQSNETSYHFKGTSDQEFEINGTIATANYMNVIVDKTPAKSAHAPEKDGEGAVLNYQADNGKAGTVTMNSGLILVNGVLTIDEGTLDVNSNSIRADAGMVINDGGTMTVDANGKLELDDGGSVDINDGGMLELMGSAGNEAMVTHYTTSGYYGFNINPGGTISAEHCIFEYTGLMGVNVKSGSAVDPAHAFNYCEFRNGYISSVSSFLTINNNQSLTITGAQFPDASTAAYNVAKDSDQGNVTMAEPAGAFAGEEYEYDPHGRIDWLIPVSGLWTGAVSSDWHEPGNWDGGGIPDATVDVTIPAGCPNYPSVESADAECANIVVEAGANLRVYDEILTISGELEIFGTMTMDHADGILHAWSVIWKAGSDDLDITTGNIYTNEWMFEAGTMAQLGVGNTVTIYITVDCKEETAFFGNLVFSLPPESKSQKQRDETRYINTLGNLTIDSGEWSSGTLTVYNIGGDMIINESAGFVYLLELSMTSEIHGDLILDGYLHVWNELMLHGQLNTSPTSVLYIPDDFICDMPADSKALFEINGHLEMNSDAQFEVAHNHVGFSGTATENITGGTIRCGGSFIANADGNFTPENLTVEMIPESGGKYVQMHENNFIPNLHINGSVSTLLHSDVHVTNDLIIESGGLSLNSWNLHVGGDWQNNAGTAYFSPGSGTVTFNGAGDQYCYGEDFNHLILNKPSGELIIPAGAVVECDDYNWQSGAVHVTGGEFLVEDLVDAGVYGSYLLDDGVITLVQDPAQYADMLADITIHDGTFTIAGGDGMSYFAWSQNATLTMNGGILDFIENGIMISAAGETFTENITGGHIRTNRDFQCNVDSFTPEGGTLELYGGTNATLWVINGELNNLTINKSGGDKGTFTTRFRDGSIRETTRSNEVNLDSDLVVNGYLSIQSGTINTHGFDIGNIADLYVNDGGVMSATAPTQIKLTNGAVFSVNIGGRFESYGSAGNMVTVANSGGYHTMRVKSGGTISAEYTGFYNSNINGLNIQTGAGIDPIHPLHHCEFDAVETGGTLLTIDNEQVLSINGVVFNNTDGNAQYNVTKTVDEGEITFNMAAGDFAGSAHENDPHGRIHWTAPEAGLWTGAVSTDWHTPGNWDDGAVPEATVDVTIPAGCPNYPSVESADAECAHIVVEAGANLRVYDETLTITNDLEIFGTMTMDHPDGVLNVDEFIWREGSDDLDLNQGEIYADAWQLDEGTMVQIGTGNTLYTYYYFGFEENASVGNLIFAIGKARVFDGNGKNKASQFVNVSGNCTCQAGLTGSFGNSIIDVEGTFTIEEGASFQILGIAELDINGAVNISGTLQLDHEAIFKDDVIVNETASLDISEDGSLICSAPSSEKSLIDFQGELIMEPGAVFESTHRGIDFGLSATETITGGTIRSGGSFIANADGNFTPENLTVEMIPETANYYVQMHENNFIPILHINGAASTYLHSDILVTDNLIIDDGGLVLNTYDFYISGDWQNNSGPGYFTPGESTVTFTGPGNSTITTDESFYNLVVNKPNPTFSFLILDDGVTVNVENDLEIVDGTLEMNDNSTLDVDRDLTIEAGAGLNAYSDTGLEIYLAGHWANYNATYDDHVGFNPGTSTIIFDGPDEEQEFFTTAEYEEFYNMVINKTGGIGTWSVNFNENIRVLNNLHVIDGHWSAFGFTQHEILGDITVEPDGYFVNLLASLTLSGSQDQNLTVDGQFNTGSLTIDKAGKANQVNGHGYFSTHEFNVLEGSASFDFSGIFNVETLSVYDGGTLTLADSCFLELQPGGTIDVFTGGSLSLSGSEGKEVKVFADDDGSWSFNVLAGGDLAAEHAWFSDLDAAGIVIEIGGTVDPAMAFNHTQFSRGTPGGKFLSINNGQTLFIDNISFLNADWDMEANISKTNDIGEIFITSHSGDFSGEAFDEDPYDRVHWENGPEQHLVPIAEGWSGISSYIEPMNLALNHAFGQLEDFIIAYNHAGIYYPAYNINTMGSWPIKGVFTVKNGSDETMIVNGYPDEDKTVLIHDYWTLIPVVSRCAVDVEDLFAAHTGDLLMVKEIAGYKVYWPGMGINTLGALEPGKAYFALASDAFSFTYEDCEKSTAVSGGSNTPSINYQTDALMESACWNTPSSTPASHTIALSKEAIGGFEPGSIIGVFDQNGQCFGVITLDGEATCLTAFGDDGYSASKDGFIAGDQLLYKLYKPSTGEEFVLEPLYDLSMPQYDGTFAENGISAITGFKAGSAGIGDGSVVQTRIYPNPSDGMVYLSGCPAGATLGLSDAQGQVVVKAESESSRIQRLDLSGMKPGIYLLSIRTKGTTSFHKLILR